MDFNFQARTLVTAALLIFFMSGCSGGGGVNPVSPDFTGDSGSDRNLNSKSHSLLGLYTFILKPDRSGFEIIPQREAMFHLNALRFLEPPPPFRISLSNFEINGQIVDVDVQFHHPFEGLDQFTGFDVNGILISSGSYSGFEDPDIVVAVDGDVRLLNPDGLSRWWNPREFPFNETVPMWGYIDGGLGTPDEIANYTATLNGYKYHAYDLFVNDDLADLEVLWRGMFPAGSRHSRHYKIDMAGGFVFNYAIDACWLPPEGAPPYDVPESFPEGANREEPWLLSVSVTENSLLYNTSTGMGGGELQLQVDCYDWFHGDENTVRVESPGIFIPALSDIPIGGTNIYSTYIVDIEYFRVYSLDPVEIWVSAEAGMGYDGFLPDKPTATFLPPVYADVEEDIPSTGYKLFWNEEGLIAHPAQLLYPDIEPALIMNGDDEILLSFFWYELVPDHIWNHPMFARSYDNAHSFDVAELPQWVYHGSSEVEHICWNSKLTLGSNGQAFHSYWCPAGHTVQANPKLPILDDTCSHTGTRMENAGEMLYTSEGYPMMFGDYEGDIKMRRGDYPNQAGTQTWPTFQGTEYTLVDELFNFYLSLSRSALKTSDGICHLMYWSEGLPYLSMISSSDTSGTLWDEPVSVFEGLAEVWVGGRNPGLWIDDNDGFHCVFAAEYWWGEYLLLYGYSVDGTDFSEMSSFQGILTVPVEDGLNDTQVVVFDAYDETWIFISYESGGNVFCVYKNMDDLEFSEPIRVNVYPNASVPDIYPNGETGAVFAYQAAAESGDDSTDIYFRLAEFIDD